MKDYYVSFFGNFSQDFIGYVSGFVSFVWWPTFSKFSAFIISNLNWPIPNLLQRVKSLKNQVQTIGCHFTKAPRSLVIDLSKHGNG